MSTAMIEPADDEGDIDSPMAPIGHLVTIRDLIATPQFRDVVVFAGQSCSDNVVEEVVWWNEHGVGACDGALVILESREPVPAYRLEAGLHAAKSGGAAAVLLLGSAGRPVVSTTRLADRLGLPLLSVDHPDPRSFSHSLAVAIRSPEVGRARQLRSLVRALRARHRTGESVLRTFAQVTGLRATVVAGDGSLLIGEPVDIPRAARLDHQVPQQIPVEQGVLVLHPVQTKALRGGEVWLVAVVPAATRPWIDSTSDLLTILEPTIAAWLVDERLGAERNSRFRSRLLTELISGGDDTSQKIAQQAVAAGWQLLGWHTGFFVGMSDSGLGGARRDVVLMQTERVRRVLHSAKLTNEVVELQDGWPPGSPRSRNAARSTRSNCWTWSTARSASCRAPGARMRASAGRTGASRGWRPRWGRRGTPRTSGAPSPPGNGWCTSTTWARPAS
ncbi:hypothetical protein [Umezawaea sp. Da 62-37]|uniref:hypothetical protein n=1 Tax=Umezawaea sp. Da 62-37 TaxID=3075927 RepID=UPI0028F6E9F9|nr:hypothetical protein [Umezawaea sp. Da 62-37]WNV87954.1 hypothetical protein RM788_06610 [Umezawaea sp. Da 62-37]